LRLSFCHFSYVWYDDIEGRLKEKREKKSCPLCGVCVKFRSRDEGQHEWCDAGSCACAFTHLFRSECTCNSYTWIVCSIECVYTCTYSVCMCVYMYMSVCVLVCVCAIHVRVRVITSFTHSLSLTHAQTHTRTCTIHKHTNVHTLQVALMGTTVDVEDISRWWRRRWKSIALLVSLCLCVCVSVCVYWRCDHNEPQHCHTHSLTHTLLLSLSLSLCILFSIRMIAYHAYH
jgi:hypothetical protein